MAYHDDDFDESTTHGALDRPTALARIIDAAWNAALTPDAAASLNREGQKTAVIVVPDPSWVRPLARRIDGLLGSGWARLEREGSKRLQDRSDVGNDEIVHDLAKGRNVVGIAHNASILPAALVASADINIELKRPNADVVATAIRNYLGRKSLPSGVPAATSLDLMELAACFRLGSAKAIVERIDRAQGSKVARFGDDIPDLRTATEYGAARDWGLALAADIREFQRPGSKLAWGEIECNALLHSKPGLGKTTFCAALARNLGAHFISTSISDMFANSPGYLDSIIKELRGIYQQAEANSGVTVIMFDEVDALPTRVGLDSRSASWWTAVITEVLLLTAKVRPNVVQIACTNFIEKVDPALRRPGRFGRVIEMLPPGPEGIVSMARFHLRGELADADLSMFGQIATGMTAAEVMAAVRTARGTARAENRALRVGDLIDALVPQINNFSENDLSRITLHEAGHATVGLALAVDELCSVQIGGGHGMGSTQHRRRNELETRQDIEDRVTMMLAGRAAEAEFLSDIADGSNGDLRGATVLVASVHAALGLGQMMISVGSGDLDDEVRLNPALRKFIEADLSRLQERANAIVRDHRQVVEEMASALAKRRHLTGDEARQIFAKFAPKSASSLQLSKDRKC
jgi:cell division protease FtsH